VADGDGLENRCACKRTVGSNPTLSASMPSHRVQGCSEPIEVMRFSPRSSSVGVSVNPCLAGIGAGNGVALTEPTIRRAKPRDRAYRLTGQRGLYISTTGHRSWLCRYERDGGEPLPMIGPYPEIGLAEAHASRQNHHG
jgi:hypothetical protein